MGCSVTKDKGIVIQNIYYMLSYAFQFLRQNNYQEIESERFEEIYDLFAAILSRGLSQQLKQGLYREYILRTENLLTLRGKMDVRETISNRIRQELALNCQYDELSVDNIYNQIIKTTVMGLLRVAEVKSKYKAELKKLILFLDEVSYIEPSEIQWSRLYYHQNNRNYEMLLNICYFILNGMLQTTTAGNYKMQAFSDEHMHRLYEKFVLEYYKRHHQDLDEIGATEVKWNLSPETDNRMIRFLPEMHTDIFLRKGKRILIIDTKYYSRIMLNRYDKLVLNSGNLYQIFAYVKNQDKDHTGDVSGLVLYAKTEEEIVPDCSYMMDGNRISVKTWI